VLAGDDLPLRLLLEAAAGLPGLLSPPGVRRGRDAPAAARPSAVPTATSAVRRGRASGRAVYQSGTMAVAPKLLSRPWGRDLP